MLTRTGLDVVQEPIARLVASIAQLGPTRALINLLEALARPVRQALLQVKAQPLVLLARHLSSRMPIVLNVFK